MFIVQRRRGKNNSWIEVSNNIPFRCLSHALDKAQKFSLGSVCDTRVLKILSQFECVSKVTHKLKEVKDFE